MPTVDLPTISVTASQPGADPETMAATVAAPLERRLGEIAGGDGNHLAELARQNPITVQFDLNRNIDGAARDVQAAINAARPTCRATCRSGRRSARSNPAAAPIMILALTSKTVPASAIYDAADTGSSQRVRRSTGSPRSRSTAPNSRPSAFASIRSRTPRSGSRSTTCVPRSPTPTRTGPVGKFNGDERAMTIATNDQLRTVPDYDPSWSRPNGTVVRLSRSPRSCQGCATATPPPGSTCNPPCCW